MDPELKYLVLRAAILAGCDLDSDIVFHNGHKYYVYLFTNEVT